MYLYTVNFGNYDQIPPNHYYSKKVKYICFYNQQIVKRKGWEYIKINSSKDSKNLSRNFKIGCLIILTMPYDKINEIYNEILEFINRGIIPARGSKRESSNGI